MKVADGKSYEAKGIGQVTLKTKYGQLVLKNVLFIPEFTTNLISLTQLMKQDISLVFKNKKAHLFQNGIKIAVANVKQGVLKLNANQKLPAVTNVANSVTNEVWHKRFNHLNYDYLRKLKQRLFDEKSFDFNINQLNKTCHPCIEGKMRNVTFAKSLSKANKPFELVHSDVCAMDTESIGGNRYFVTFIDDFTSFCYCFPIKRKSQVPDLFIDFVTAVQTQYDRRVKILRSDRGGEYVNETLATFLQQKGIIHQTTAPMTPQQNGKSEVFNRIIVDKVRTMLLESGLPKTLWAEALMCAVYTKNRSPTKGNPDFKSPFEMLFGKLPSFSRLKCFGTIAFRLDKSVSKRKLDPKSKPYVFVGYANNSKAYRLLDLSSNLRKVVEDVAVNFDESISYKQYVQNQNQERQIPFHKIEHTEPPLVIKSEQPDLERSSDSSEHSEYKLVSKTKSEVKNEVKNESGESSPFKVLPQEIDKKEPSFLKSDSSSPPPAAPDADSDKPPSLPPKTRKSTRVTKRPNYFQSNIVLSSASHYIEPNSYQEAEKTNDWLEWQKAINEELTSIKDNKVWSLVDKTECMQKKPLTTRWVFKRKTDRDKNIIFRARLVVKGFEQKYGIDFSETYAPVTTNDTIRTVLAHAAFKGNHIHQLDVKTAFLNANLSEEIFIEIPDGHKEQPGKILKLNKALYGLKQSPRQWNETLHEFLISQNFQVSNADQCLYNKTVNDTLITVVIYVDDIIISSSDLEEIEKVKSVLSQRFKIRDLGATRKFLGFEIDQSENQIKIHQHKFAKQLIEKFNLSNCKTVSTPAQVGVKLRKRTESEESVDSTMYRSAIGCLLYLANCTRPDISYAVSYAARFSSDPTTKHWNYVKHILKYVKSTLETGIIYKKCKSLTIETFSDSDFASDTEQCKSTTGNITLINGSPISWNSNKQSTIALSTTEAETIALTSAVRNALYLNKIFSDLKLNVKLPLKIFGDNNAANSIVSNNINSNRTKHMTVKYAFIKSLIDSKQIQIHRVDSAENRADILTKALPKVAISIHKSNLNLE